MVNVLHEATYYGKIVNVVRLLDAGIDINGRDIHGHTAIMLACTKWRNDVKWVDLIKLLIARGANIHIQSNRGTTVLHLASLYNNAEIVSILLKHGAKMDITDQWGDTPLHEAIETGIMVLTCGSAEYASFIRVVKLLLDHGADIHLKNNQGYSPLESITRLPIPCGYPVNEVKEIFYPYEQICRLSEWRPWNHYEYPLTYRQVVLTMALLSKTCIT